MEQNNYIEGGIYTNYQGQPSIYCGRYRDSTGEIRPTFVDVKGCPPYGTNEEIVRYVRKKGTKKIMDMITLAPVAYTGYDYGYMGQLPKTIYTRIHKRVEEWMAMPVKFS